MDNREGQQAAGEPADKPATTCQSNAAKAAERGDIAATASAARYGESEYADGLASPERPLTPVEAMRISLLRNVRYHEDREGHFGLWNRLGSLFVLLSGTASFAAFSNTFVDQRWAPWIGVFTTLIGGVQLVFRRAALEYQHGTLRKSFLGLTAELKDDNVDAVRAKADRLYRDEPPTFYACDAIAYNAAMDAFGRRTYREVTFWQRRLRHWWRFEAGVFEEKRQL